jgi:hexokinase
MADVPKDLLQEIKRLEEQFTVSSAKLKAITDHFVSELTKGMISPRGIPACIS